MKLPTLFISHGSPMFAVDAGLLGPKLTALGHRLPTPRAVLVVSPHWMTRGIAVGSSAAPETIHDFGGFPRVLYQLDYPAPGAPGVAAEVIALLAQAGVQVMDDAQRGRDHGAWVPMMHLYPEANIPVIQLSQPSTPSPLALLELGRALAPLREQGVLIIGSGSMTHNLYDMGIGPSGSAYASAFADWVAQKLSDGDLAALLDYRTANPDARRAHPTDEHFLPLFFAMGAAGEDWTRVERIEGGITNDVLSMDSFMFGDQDAQAVNLPELAS
jgi:4,5-DOPA dioxygenase extradiol